MRILVAGGPRVGKTTLAAKLGQDLGVIPLHTDDLIGYVDWSAASDTVARWITSDGPWVIEGVAVVRALRKWLDGHPGKPADAVYLGERSYGTLTTGQLAMTRGHQTIWNGIEGELRHRGVPVHTF